MVSLRLVYQISSLKLKFPTVYQNRIFAQTSQLSYIFSCLQKQNLQTAKHIQLQKNKTNQDNQIKTQLRLKQHSAMISLDETHINRSTLEKSADVGIPIYLQEIHFHASGKTTNSRYRPRLISTLEFDESWKLPRVFIYSISDVF